MDLIVAVDQNWAIGKDGEQLLYLSQDLKRFKALTMGHPLILGRKTMATFPGGRPLKGRRNLILSRNPDFAPEGGEVYHTMEELLSPFEVVAYKVGMNYAEPFLVQGTATIGDAELDQAAADYVSAILD